MRAALLESYGQTPAIVDLPEPEGDAPLGTVIAAGLNPVDRTISGGEFYAIRPKPPYTPGMEGVARTADGELVYFGRPGDLKHGSMAEQLLLDPEQCFTLPEGTDPGRHSPAASRSRRVDGDQGCAGSSRRASASPSTGATGVAGRIAVQVARLLGAGHVVAIGRDEEELAKLDGLVDDVICFKGPMYLHEVELKRLGGHDLTVDFTWGPLAMAALNGQNKHGRLVQVGSASQPGLGLTAPDLRGNEWSILGFSIFNYALEERRREYLELLGHVREGRIDVVTNEIGLDDVPGAWEAQGAGSPHAKTVIRIG